MSGECHKCLTHGCRNLQTTCMDCGRVVLTATFPERNEWISFKERFPNSKDYEEVLTFEFIENIKTKKQVSIICLEETKSIHIDKNGIYSDGGGQNLTHWMPLPLPPKE